MSGPSQPLFYPARPPAHWLMVAEVSGRVLTVPLAPANSGGRRRCRPIGCYVAAVHAAPHHQVPQGPPVRRKAKLPAPVPVRFPDGLLQEARDRAAADDGAVAP